MMAQFTSKLAAFVVAVMMNAIIFAWVGYVFNMQWNSNQPGSLNLANRADARAYHPG
jgi:hypothetical protein